ncbi:MAG: Pr6Pr family membrane protein, partial [Erysipelotrichaceae bacterium]|nr:Pr6Pr family membrane protein [Erysipelotrichaceae bacterium]
HFLIHPELVRLYRNGENVKPYSLANLSLHYFVPLLTIAYWIFFGHKADLNYLDALRWLIIPLTYLGYIFLRRALKIQVEEFCHGYYPYSFIDLEQLGVAAVLRNSLLLLAGYALLGAVFVFIAGII